MSVMMSDIDGVQIISSPDFARARPALSVLVPYYHDNPSALLNALAEQSSAQVECLFYDDGTQDPTLTDHVTQALGKAQNTQAIISVHVAARNHGRAFARNYLVKQARADWVLFLDADMLPVQPNFLSAYLDVISQNCADVIFGGFEVSDETGSSETELHRAFSKTSDAIDVTTRQEAGPKYVCTSNLCVKTSVLQAEPFDQNFSGWGWEDSEWAARISHAYRLRHIDNPALHLGLESTDTLLTRFKTSGPNYARFTTKHPDLAKQLTLYKVIMRLKRIPGHALFRPVFKVLVKADHLPMSLRIFALKLWRASWYADAGV